MPAIQVEALSLPLQRWAPLLAQFLSRLHQFPVEDAGKSLAEIPPTPDKRGLPPVLVHGDLGGEHFLCDPARQEITGVIDWSDMAVSDPSIDFAGLFHWGGEPLVRAVLAAYDRALDEGVLSRARFLAACRGAADVAFGLDTGRREYIDAGLRALTLVRPHGGLA